jgi:hypothetical protein
MVALSESSLRLFIVATLFFALLSFLIGLASLTNFAFPSVIVVGGSLFVAVFLVVYLLRSGCQIPREYYSVIAGALDCLLGFVIAYTCFPNLGVSVGNFVSYSGQLGIAAVNFAGVVMAFFGVAASVFALFGGVSALMKRNFVVARLGAYLVFGWFGTWFLCTMIPSVVLLGAPTVFAWTFSQLVVNLVAFMTLFLLPSLLSIILVRESRVDFV